MSSQLVRLNRIPPDGPPVLLHTCEGVVPGIGDAAAR